MASNKLVGNVGVVVSAILAFLWTLTLTRPWTWLWSENSVILFKVNLLSIYIGKSTVGQVAKIISTPFGKKTKRAMDSLFDHNYWITSGVQQLCSPLIEGFWRWCNIWELVKYASLVFIFLGLITVVCLAAGSGLFYYYTHKNATEEGRYWIRGCFIAAPCCAVVGLSQYILLTMQLGQNDGAVLTSNSSYGLGFIVACFLTLVSPAPLYLHIIYTKSDEFAKRGDCEDDGFLQKSDYGATQPPSGYTMSPGAATSFGTGPAGMPMPSPGFSSDNFGIGAGGGAAPPGQYSTGFVQGGAGPPAGGGAPYW